MTVSPAAELAAHPFFVDLADEVVAAVAPLVSRLDADPGQVLGREGEPAGVFYALTAGRVALEVHAADRPPALLETLQAGDVVGWSWLVPPYRWHFDAVAVGPVSAIRVDGARLRAEMDADPVLGYALAARFIPVIVDRLQATRLRLLDLYGHDHR
ncbi:MAG TPA: Crp/Fnr family transcriptional regulator [Mycobacteriales bacterium]|nr:Crp/Fnr family transcriptional regulator [Mycobacteriales bacterium]